jgi:L-proline dehydrogenase (EC 1.5.99.8)/delta-1-pyrroline-5-carboxylate dehydrogenase (EC 1.5.1.12)
MISVGQAINRFYRAPEEDVLQELLKHIHKTSLQDQTIKERALNLARNVRQAQKKASFIERLMIKYELTSKEGLALMALAESLIRIPDHRTAQLLIEDKMQGVHFDRIVDASDRMTDKLTNKVLSFTSKFLEKSKHRVLQPLKEKSQQVSGPVVVSSSRWILRLLANQFVMGQSIEEALKQAREKQQKGYRYSFDMLGEAAYTRQDAEKYYHAYLKAIQALGEKEQHLTTQRSSISIKLSALHPRYEYAKQSQGLGELTAIVKALALEAKKYNVALTLDAEETARLEISLILFEKLCRDKELENWDGLGIAVQAYQKRAFDVIVWLESLAQETHRQIPVRLVKGAYWDTEIKIAQELGLVDYPVFTRKVATDVSYLACAQRLLNNPTAFYPQFATHNAQTVAAILEFASDPQAYEFQGLYGMGQALYDYLLPQNPALGVRIYAPVGIYRDLLPYLVRRLLENGANSSFVHANAQDDTLLEDLVQDPVQALLALDKPWRHPSIPEPAHIVPTRLNSRGLDLTAASALAPLQEAVHQQWTWTARPMIGKQQLSQPTTMATRVCSPIDGRKIGEVTAASPADLREALHCADQAQPAWAQAPVAVRAAALEKTADLLEEHRLELIALCTLEAGKTFADGIAEVREAIDFCRYYALEARRLMAEPLPLPAVTGEENTLSLKARGVFLCISPWNFPLAIFTGQVVAALVCGNAVLAKPAGQTPLIAARAVELMHQAGIPAEVLHLIPASGQEISEVLLPDARIKGVCFTGSTETARTINQTLAMRQGPLIPLIAETGGQNVMLVDSTALPEQVVHDVIASSFQSAGQRCSALRILLVQEEIAEQTLTMLKGAMAELEVGNPMLLSTDVGPVIDKKAQRELENHILALEQSKARCIAQVKVPLPLQEKGSYVPPCAYEIDSLSCLDKEHFGPILHVMRYKASALNEKIAEINALGFGLTFGLHSRIQGRAKEIANKLHVGNIYVNRNMIGAVVEMQPFGGQGLSGTGPKAGGPHYLLRFLHEQTLSINTTAHGGNASLLAISS